MSDDLVKRLRDHIAVYLDDRGHVFEDEALCDDAADRIEELEAKLKAITERNDLVEYANVELGEKLSESEALLAKAVEALGTALSEMVDYADTHPAWSEIWEAREAARTTLAELSSNTTGGKDE